MPDQRDRVDHKPLGKKWLKRLLSTVTGSVALMLLSGIALYAVGVWQTGAANQWAAALQAASIPLLLFRLLLYGVLAGFCYQTWVLQTRKGNHAGVSRIKRIALASAVIIVLVELSRFAPFLLGGQS